MLRTRLILLLILSEGRAGEACNTSDKSNALSNIGECETVCSHAVLCSVVCSAAALGNGVATFRYNVLPSSLTYWRRNYFFFNFSTSCIQNVNNTGTKYVRIMKQTAFKKKRSVYIMFKIFSTYIC